MIALDEWKGRPAAAMVVDGRLSDLIVDPPAEIVRPGTVYLAVTDRPVKGQGGIFVRLPQGGTGFLRAKDGVKPGQPVLVQVTGYGEPGKATPLTSKLLLKGRFAILTPGAPGLNISRRIKDEEVRLSLHDAVSGIDLGGGGAILRSNTIEAEPEDVAAELEELATLGANLLSEGGGRDPALLLDGPNAHELALRDWPSVGDCDDTPGSFARHGIDEMVDGVSRAQVQLDGGATAWIEPTRALVAVDVNTGGDTSAAAGLKANVALTRDLPRQLRCRGLGGQITIDFAPMPKRDRRQIEQIMRSAFRGDETETAMVGWTPLGHYELQRKRDRFHWTEPG